MKAADREDWWVTTRYELLLDEAWLLCVGLWADRRKRTATVSRALGLQSSTENLDGRLTETLRPLVALQRISTEREIDPWDVDAREPFQRLRVCRPD